MTVRVCGLARVWRQRLGWAACAFVIGLSHLGLSSAEAEPIMRAYFGTYTGGESEGIYVADYDPDEGVIGEVKLAAKTEHPSFLAIHPSGQFLYAVGELTKYEGEATGFVRAFRIDAESGKLEQLNTLKSDGGAPCHLVVDGQGTTLLVANYMGGNVAAFRLRESGELGAMTASHKHQGSSVDRARQEAPHAHSINLDAANRFAFAADLGIDKIVAYRFDAESDARLLTTKSPAPVAVPAGSGPRHFAFHPSGRYGYVINEMLSTITAFRYSADDGKLEATQNISTLPADFQGGSSTAEVVVHPSGRFVYGSNRGHDSIAVFAVNASNGQLSLLQIEKTGGETPRNFVLDPSGRFLLAENQSSGTVNVFSVDAKSGRITLTGLSAVVPSPVCIRFWSSEK